MPLAPPVIDDRRFGQLVEETLARARVHTPEWTNFGQGDPGVTLVQLFSFLTESLLYRANLIPERNRTRFLELLRVPLAPATAAAGLVAIRNERGAAVAQTLPADLEVRAGAVPFRTQLGLDVLPVEAHAFFKRRVTASADLLAYYQLLYASYQAELPEEVDLYQAVALEPRTVESVDLAQDTVDGALWVALVARRGDDPAAVRPELGGRTLTLGIVPALEAATARLVPGGQSQPRSLLRFELPMVPAGGQVERTGDGRPAPRYRQLEPRTDTDLLASPGVVQLTLPSADGLGLWEGVDPLEGGVGDMPPTLEDTALAERVVTWLRVRADGAARARIRWAGINTVPVRQIERIVAEPLADGDGTPDQERRLARAPVLPGTVSVVTRLGADAPERWEQIDDLAAAAPEVPVADWKRPPGAPAADEGEGPTRVFELDAEAGVLRFGDGLRGRRLPRGARVFASYEYSAGAAGNVPEGAIDGAPQLPSGFTVTNPVRSWGGADAESVDAGEKQIRRYLRHRDRLVSVEDFESIVCRAPGVQIGRVEVLPAFHPDLVPAEPGAAPGVVTVMAIPLLDPGQPDAPRADRLFLNALCRYLEPRRLVTTELVLRGAEYKGIWISVGVEVASGLSIAEVVENVKARLRARLAPVGPDGCAPGSARPPAAGAEPPARGWPLRTPVEARVLLAEAARVPGVTSVAGVLLAEGSRAPADAVEMAGLELPRVLGISVVAGEPVPIDALRGSGTAGTGAGTGRRLLPVPVVPESC
ncbi:MAG TPA: baseplate J/gp47 family protein [Longimicrobium sp.]|nr:baseplate J/gp47 family protein [Longimicrobium sp.]